MITLIVITFVLPVACNTLGCGGSGGSPNYFISGQEVSATVEVDDAVGIVELNILIDYLPMTAAMNDDYHSFGTLMACSPAPQYFQNDVTSISITSNKSFVLPAGDELIELFQWRRWGESNTLEFPLNLELGEYFQLQFVGDQPADKEQVFTIKTITSDQLEFENAITIAFP
jgi:hypothetical protein